MPTPRGPHTAAPPTYAGLLSCRPPTIARGRVATASGTGRSRRAKQAGKAFKHLRGDRGETLFPDGGAPPLKVHIQRFQHKPGDGHGSHHNGRHMMG